MQLVMNILLIIASGLVGWYTISLVIFLLKLHTKQLEKLSEAYDEHLKLLQNLWDLENKYKMKNSPVIASQLLEARNKLIIFENKYPKMRKDRIKIENEYN